MNLELPPKILEEINRICEEKKLGKEEKEKIIANVRKAWESCLITPGVAIGVVAAQSIGEPGTQLTMRTKLTSGVGEITITLGLPRLIEILDAKKEPSTPTMQIYLKKEYRNAEDAKRVAKKLLEITCKNIADEITIDLIEKRIEILLNLKKMKALGVRFDEVNAALRNLLKAFKIRKKENWIILTPKRRRIGVKELYDAKNFVENLHIKGIHGIKQVLPIKERDEWIIKTSGSNLKDVLKLKEVDPTRTITNDIFEVARVLGIEAARNMIVEEIERTLSEQGVVVDIRHILLIADLMCWSGRIRGVTRYGITGEKASVLTRASFEIPLHHLVEASIFNEIDEFRSIIPNVIANQPIPIGTGIPKLIYGVSEDGGNRGAKEK
ncbi:MAG: DNA-directed RNA polymerase subunit A'' [Candidatus Nanoarchaeia archaeon]|nr:DNA-directed RNA polymerase subunit A'' [Candidatus Haiyanarchaeum thermophilum]MCW1303080.1 DNA-directed RNA polymerase subunit A'' [Candidatus Haiyanarchaeum thermophilum]MCW1303745.1 DNA-directed RNA polymerase subunit A'' [Candidatus Haiyanarchaeum thermophilum]MCW1306810.1 DNA-directed RNA polymerase subunit A'' [Candidatus Haiyanarchaeum thermophilum]MCW1307052.1 DNA-directed RNA polymerase subunit A'' [Candidatus Haiyanarchaeum thermophilum]